VLEAEIRSLEKGRTVHRKTAGKGTKEEETQEAEQLKRKIEMLCAENGRYKSKGQGSAVHLLKQFMVRIMRGESGMRLEIWRQRIEAANKRDDDSRTESLWRLSEELKVAKESSNLLS